MNSTRIYGIAAIAVVVASGIVFVGQAGASARPGGTEQHCVIEVTRVEAGVFLTQPEVCFGSQTEAVTHAASVGAESSGQGALGSGTNTIGTHFTSTSYSGSSVRIVGTTCGGGVWYPTGAWNNNIESSRHHCGPVTARSLVFRGLRCLRDEFDPLPHEEDTP